MQKLDNEEAGQKDAFEMWCWRKMLAIPWTAKRTNKSILEQKKPDMSFKLRLTKLQLAYFGHHLEGTYTREGHHDGKNRRNEKKRKTSNLAS